jgi:hypothetical protein
LRKPHGIMLALTLSIFTLNGGCSKQQQALTNDKVKELLEASSDFQPHLPDVTLTQDEVQKGNSAGYWDFSKEGEHHRENSQLIILTPQGMQYFRGTPLMRHPVLSLKQELGANLVEIKDIQPVPNAPDYAVVTYTWTLKFANQIPELELLFKDQPVQDGKKTFHYASNGWEIAQ